jgi:hypothetical protein
MHEEEIQSIEAQHTGTHGSCRLLKHINGDILLEFTKTGENPVYAPLSHLNLKEMRAKSLDAVFTHLTETPDAELLTYDVTTIRGPKALALIYKSRSCDDTFGKFIRRGSEPLKFNLSRIDLKNMRAETPEQALRKAAFHSGNLRLLPTQTLATKKPHPHPLLQNDHQHLIHR